ncbi:uncharacterized protein LOC100377224 [Saccoglossus kowalevskii]|uniref:Uncharacterized protein LOC100377224 n=1 Tax=Saccoglossus kowalevskii TaxID=10224 RepID=A0ABM0GNH2_SACKO|nr:PREDICTED: uncharacterized protein LOC100377224 [Saccoglossus kowalevskii]
MLKLEVKEDSVISPMSKWPKDIGQKDKSGKELPKSENITIPAINQNMKQNTENTHELGTLMQQDNSTPQLGGEKTPQQDNKIPSRISRRKGKVPPRKKLKTDIPEESSDDDSECGRLAIHLKEDMNHKESTIIKQEPMIQDERCYGIMPTSSLTNGPNYRSVQSEKTYTNELPDKEYSVETNQPQTTRLQTTYPLQNGLITPNLVPVNPAILQDGRQVLIAALPGNVSGIAAAGSIPYISSVPQVEGGNPLNLIAATAALASRVHVVDSPQSADDSISNEDIDENSCLSKKERAEKQPVPDEQKDHRYFERRRRNNAAAKRSRDARRLREEEMSLRISQLEHENSFLRSQLAAMREKAESLRKNLVVDDDVNSTTT